MPARKIERVEPRSRGGHLRAVRRAPARSSTARRPGRLESRVRTLFVSTLVLFVAVTGLGLVRVAVIARAAEVTINADRLLADIKAQRVEAGRLEVDASSLSTPSRLESIASASMGMAPPVSVRYIKMPATTPVSEGSVRADAGATTPGAGIGGMLGALVDMSAGEAQSLLLGDVGLAGTR